MGGSRKREFVKWLLEWYEGHARNYPWRTAGNPWFVLLAETMLQRTQAVQVLPVYQRAIERFPTPAALADASDSELLEAFGALGLHHRIARIRALAQQLVIRHEGRVPCDYESLESLPGVGPYIANAALCFGCGIDAALVDPNIIRIFEHVFGVRSEKQRPRTDPALWAFAASLIPKGKCREYNAALLDFEHHVVSTGHRRSSDCDAKPYCWIHGGRRRWRSRGARDR